MPAHISKPLRRWALKGDLTRIRGLIGKGGDKLIPEAFGLEQNSAGEWVRRTEGQDFQDAISAGFATGAGYAAATQPPAS